MTWSSTTLAFGGIGAAAMATAAGEAQAAAGTVQGQAPVADRARSHGAAHRVVRAVLRLRRSPVLPLRRSARGDRRAAAGWLHAAGGALSGALCRNRPADRRTGRRHFRPAVHRRLSGAVSIQPHRAPAPALRLVPAVVGRRDGHRSRRQRVLRPHRLVRRQPVRLRLLQGLHGARRGAGPRARPGARRLSSGDRRLRGAAEGDLRPRRSVVPHVGHRGRHAGGAARALSHAPVAPGALLRRLSRLVGRRAAGRRQSDAGARDLHAEGHVGGLAARAAQPRRHRLRAGQSVAGAASRTRARRPTRRWSTARARRISTGRPTPTGSSGCARSAPSATSC